MKIVGMCQIYNEVENGNLERALKHYEQFCDEIVILDDASIDSPNEVIGRYKDGEGCPIYWIVNNENNWSKQKETTNKNILLQRAKSFGADWVINFDADEIFESSFSRVLLEKSIDWAESIGVKSYCFRWLNLWLSEYFYRSDGGLNMTSPVRIYKVLPDAKVEQVDGLHQRLWPKYADNPQKAPWGIIHYSSATVDSLVGKIVRYCLLDKRFSSMGEAKQYYLYNLLNNVQVISMKLDWYPEGVRPCEIENKNPDEEISRLHAEVVQKVEEKLNE